MPYALMYQTHQMTHILTHQAWHAALPFSLTSATSFPDGLPLNGTTCRVDTASIALALPRLLHHTPLIYWGSVTPHSHVLSAYHQYLAFLLSLRVTA